MKQFKDKENPKLRTIKFINLEMKEPHFFFAVESLWKNFTTAPPYSLLKVSDEVCRTSPSPPPFHRDALKFAGTGRPARQTGVPWWWSRAPGCKAPASCRVCRARGPLPSDMSSGSRLPCNRGSSEGRRSSSPRCRRLQRRRVGDQRAPGSQQHSLYTCRPGVSGGLAARRLSPNCKLEATYTSSP